MVDDRSKMMGESFVLYFYLFDTFFFNGLYHILYIKFVLSAPHQILLKFLQSEVGRQSQFFNALNFSPYLYICAGKSN